MDNIICQASSSIGKARLHHAAGNRRQKKTTKQKTPKLFCVCQVSVGCCPSGPPPPSATSYHLLHHVVRQKTMSKCKVHIVLSFFETFVDGGCVGHYDAYLESADFGTSLGTAWAPGAHYSHGFPSFRFFPRSHSNRVTGYLKKESLQRDRDGPAR